MPASWVRPWRNDKPVVGAREHPGSRRRDAIQARAMNTALNGSPADRVAIVTGGSRGVGRATVRLLAGRGYAVVVHYLHRQRAAEAAVQAIPADNRHHEAAP